jgi:hypothetical protein
MCTPADRSVIISTIGRFDVAQSKEISGTWRPVYSQLFRLRNVSRIELQDEGAGGALLMACQHQIELGSQSLFSVSYQYLQIHMQSIFLA